MGHVIGNVVDGSVGINTPFFVKEIIDRFSITKNNDVCGADFQ